MCCLEFPVSVELIKESLGWIDRGFRTRFKHYQNRCKTSCKMGFSASEIFRGVNRSTG